MGSNPTLGVVFCGYGSFRYGYVGPLVEPVLVVNMGKALELAVECFSVLVDHASAKVFD